MQAVTWRPSLPSQAGIKSINQSSMTISWAAPMSLGEAGWMVHVRCSRQRREALRGTSLSPDPLCHLPPCQVTQRRIPQSPWASVSSCNRLQIITMMPEKHWELNLANRAPRLAPGFAGPSEEWKSGLLCKMYQDFFFFFKYWEFQNRNSRALHVALLHSGLCAAAQVRHPRSQKKEPSTKRCK